MYVGGESTHSCPYIPVSDIYECARLCEQNYVSDACSDNVDSSTVECVAFSYLTSTNECGLSSFCGNSRTYGKALTFNRYAHY